MATTSDSDNPIKIYLREIGEVPLITPAHEIVLAGLIRRGVKADLELKKIRKSQRGKVESGKFE